MFRPAQSSGERRLWKGIPSQEENWSRQKQDIRHESPEKGGHSEKQEGHNPHKI